MPQTKSQEDTTTSAAFLVQTTGQNNIAVGSAVTITWDTEVDDVGGNFASNTFTAPETGRYTHLAHIDLRNLDTAAGTYTLEFVTTKKTFTQRLDTARFSADVDFFPWFFGVNCAMDATDTAYFQITQAAGTQQSDIQVVSWWSGYKT